MIDPVAELAQIVPEGWLVGGTVRDRLLRRATLDYDVIIAGSVADAARKLGRAAGGFAFELSEAFGAWRVVAHDHTWQVDVLPLNGDSIEEDLSQRDFTINAIAAPLGHDGYVDPFNGLEDLQRHRLRAVSAEAFERDPLRTLRCARIACELGFAVDAVTLELARRAAPALDGVAPERVFAELRRVVCAPAAVEGLELMDRLGVTDVILPELAALRGVEQSRFHHLDVYGHTRSVLAEAIALERDPERVAGADAAALVDYLAQPLANELTRGQALRFGALLHDIAKPQTRAVTPQGRITFMGHDESGARLAFDILGRLRTSERLREHVAALTRHHLRLGFMVHDMPLSRRAVYGYLRTTAPVAVDVTVLSVADRLATRGDNSERAIAKHLELARQMLAEGLAWVADPPRPPVRGDELARALGIKPGPVVGGLLAELEAASFSGEVATREDAIARARELIGSEPRVSSRSEPE
jgi:putative nucleotidyltransferase with HDIG domain